MHLLHVVKRGDIFSSMSYHYIIFLILFKKRSKACDNNCNTYYDTQYKLQGQLFQSSFSN